MKDTTVPQARTAPARRPAPPVVVPGGTTTVQQLVTDALRTMPPATGRTTTPTEERKYRR